MTCDARRVTRDVLHICRFAALMRVLTVAGEASIILFAIKGSQLRICGLRGFVYRFDLWFVVCSLWFVVCGLWFVVCGLWFVV